MEASRKDEDEMNHEYDRDDQISQRLSRPVHEGSAARRLFWAIIGAVAFVVARLVFGF